MTLYRLTHRPDLGVFTSATAAVLAGLARGLTGADLAWSPATGARA